MTTCYISPTFINNCEVLCINDDEDNDNKLHRYLGITNERAIELGNAVDDIEKKSYKKNGQYHNGDILVETSKICKHPNELAMCCFIIGQNAGQTKQIIKVIKK